ncbi:MULTISPECIES: MFS transporter [unclassified Cryobacterium]|uniref:MFS transporter n=1 Tax=unclassified Cryobacterium TaxID=2649013 RepID=UPI002AB35034|nr:MULTISPECIES: MFS transporter [unclassified Cryobacterium]MDY7541284.1 MFS transporter [Cryobacterium sp. 5B3]MEA9998084.1 MFS transporter [Cryobacterium sp. RTS3]MEB0266546.1 MFS transporter [Cryobacterium sp. 10I5]MEB0273417.1 MFS transporter [Cryobacterium sp. 5B3]
MNKWTAVAVLGSAQFVMVLDSTVMNVSISTVVTDLDTTVAAMQSAITFYTLTMAAVMLLGAKLGDVWGRRRAFVIGAIVYSCGSLLTALSPNFVVLFLGWSVVEGLGAVLVIPAIAALVAENYRGSDRVTAYAIIGAVSGAAVAAGPLIGGYVTTYLNWRYVFVSEVVIMIGVVLTARLIADNSRPSSSRIDVPSVLLSAAGLVLVVYGMLQSKTWGWILPKQAPEINGNPIEPLGLSLVPYLILLGAFLLVLFSGRQRRLAETGRAPLLDIGLFSITQLRSGLSVLGAQYAFTAGVFFMIPIYLQMTLGLNALETGLKIFPLSIALILFSVVGTRLSTLWSPRRIVRVGQVVLVGSAACLLGSVSLDLKSVVFGIGMFTAGAALGLLASQLGNVNMSSVGEEKTSEVGGLQGVFQNLGSSLGTALIGSVLIASLSSSFFGSVESSSLPDTVKSAVSTQTEAGIAIVPVSSVARIATDAGLSSTDSAALTTIYSESQVSSLRVSFFALILFALGSLLFSRNIPNKTVARRQGKTREAQQSP